MTGAKYYVIRCSFGLFLRLLLREPCGILAEPKQNSTPPQIYYTILDYDILYVILFDPGKAGILPRARKSYFCYSILCNNVIHFGQGLEHIRNGTTCMGKGFACGFSCGILAGFLRNTGKNNTPSNISI